MNQGRWSTISPHLLRRVGVILAAGWLVYYICSGMPQVSLQVFPRVITLHAITFALAALYAGYLLIRRRLPGGSPLDWPLVLVLLAYLAATVASINWRVSVESTLLVVMVVLVCYVLSDVDFLDTMSLQRALMLAGVAASVWALWNVAKDYADWLSFARVARGSFQLSDLIPPTVPKVHGVSDHPNILGMTLTLIIPFYVVAAYRAPSRWERLGWGAALLAAGWTVFLTLSRGAWIGGLSGVTVTVAAIVATTQSWPREALGRANILSRLRERRSILLLAGGLAAATLIVIAIALLMTRWDTRPQWLFRESLSPRQDVFSAGIDMFRDHPLLGAGPGTFGLLYPEYSGEYPIHAIHAHNGYIQAAVDTGVIGLAALTVLAGSLAWLLWRSYRTGSMTERLVVVACGGALFGFAIHNLADAANVWKAPLVALAGVMAIAVRNYLRAAAARHPSEVVDVLDAKGDPPQTSLVSKLAPSLPRMLLAVVFLALFVGWGRIDAAHYHYSQSLTSLRTGAMLDAIREGKRAVDMDPDFAIYQLQLGLTEGLASQEEGSAAFLKQSIKHLRRGLELDPRSAIGYANLARALALEGDNEEARTAALAAKRFAGADATVLLATGNVLEDIGATEEAIETYGMSVTRMASIANSAFWMGSQFRRDNYDEILQHSALALNSCTLGDLLARASTETTTTLDKRGLQENCGLVVLANPNNLSARVDLADMLMASGEYESAFIHLDFAVKRQPDLGRARTALGKWYAAQGDTDRARREWTLAAQLGEAEALVLLGDTYASGQVPTDIVRRLEELAPAAAGGARYYPIGYIYYRMKFGRESPSTILMPGDWENALPSEYEVIQEALRRWRTSG